MSEFFGFELCRSWLLSDSATPFFLPPLDQRLQSLYRKWQQAIALGQPISIQDLCAGDEDLAAKLQAHNDADQHEGVFDESS